MTVALFRISVFWIFFPSTVWAYIDPGSGILFWQGFVAAVGVLIVFFKNPIKTVKNWISRMKKK